MDLPRPYAGAEALYVEASRREADASRVVFYARATADLACTWDELVARVPAALRRVQARHALLRAALGDDGFVPSDAPLPFEVVSADDPHAAAIPALEAEWRVAAEASPFRARIVLPASARAAGLRGEVPLTVLVRGHHAACDGFSLAGLAAEVLRALLDPGSLPADPPDSLPDMLAVARRELGGGWGLPVRLARAVVGFVRRGRAVAGPVLQLAPPERATPALRCRELRFDPEETARLREACRARGVGLTALLVAAAALACESPGRVDVGVAVDLRRRATATALPPSALGFYGAMTDVALAVPAGASVWALGEQATARLEDGVADARPFAVALVFAWLVPLARRLVASGRSVFPQTLLLSNAGEYAPLFEGIAGVRVVSAGFASSPRASRKFHVSTTSVRGALSVCLAWPDGALTAARVERFAAALDHALRTATPPGSAAPPRAG